MRRKGFRREKRGEKATQGWGEWKEERRELEWKGEEEGDWEGRKKGKANRGKVERKRVRK